MFIDDYVAEDFSNPVIQILIIILAILGIVQLFLGGALIISSFKDSKKVKERFGTEIVPYMEEVEEKKAVESKRWQPWKH